jgi:SAM-dependent methyltransferase
MIYTKNGLPPLWEENIAKHCEQNSVFNNIGCISSIPDTKHNIEEYLLQIPINSYSENDPYPIPAEKDREGYCVQDDARYWYLGLSDFLKIQYIAKKYNVTIDKYFDFGCASGRVLRHFLCQSKTSEIWGSDINSNHINWINQFLPKIKAIFNHTIPSLPLEDNYFDVVSAFSVFTHIDTFEIAWLSELRRILKPNGIAYITYHDEANWETLRSEQNDKNRVFNVLKRIFVGEIDVLDR